ncbi:hypothetical protein D3C80_2177760 [compost metagenome]
MAMAFSWAATIVASAGFFSATIRGPTRGLLSLVWPSIRMVSRDMTIEGCIMFG